MVHETIVKFNTKSSFGINLTSLILKIQSLNDNRKSHILLKGFLCLKQEVPGK